MTIDTRVCLTGFIASDPELTFTRQGDSRLSVRVGQEHFVRNDDGTFTQTETTFHTLIAYRRAAERGYELLRRGDHVLAEGTIHQFSYDRDGQQVDGEEFVAKRIGHDAARTNYTVERPRPTPPTSAAVTPIQPVPALRVAAPKRAVAIGRA